MVSDQNSKSNETSRFYPRSGLVIHYTNKCVCVCVCVCVCRSVHTNAVLWPADHASSRNIQKQQKT